MRTTPSRTVAVFLCTVLLAVALGGTSAQQRPDVALRAAIDKEVVDGDLQAAIRMYRALAAGSDRAVAAQALLRMGQCYEKLGATQAAEARRAYEQVVAKFADQGDVAALARARLAALGTAASAAVAGPTLRQLLPPDRDVDWSRLSPDGRALVGVERTTRDLVLRDLSTAANRRLTSIGEIRRWDDFTDEPVWSPDGRRIAYAWWMEPPGVRPAAELRIMDVSDRRTRTVALDSGYELNMPFGWSVDGTAVLGDVHMRARVCRTPGSSIRWRRRWRCCVSSTAAG